MIAQIWSVINIIDNEAVNIIFMLQLKQSVIDKVIDQWQPRHRTTLWTVAWNIAFSCWQISFSHFTACL